MPSGCSASSPPAATASSTAWPQANRNATESARARRTAAVRTPIGKVGGSLAEVGAALEGSEAMFRKLLKSQLEGHKALDTLLWERAEAQGMDTLGIETARGQLGIFDAFTEEEYLSMLAESLAQMKGDRDAGRSPIQ